MNNNVYLITLLEKNKVHQSNETIKIIDFIANSIKSSNNNEILSFSDLTNIVPDINVGTPEDPNNIPLDKMPEQVKSFLTQNIHNQLKKRYVTINLKVIKNGQLPYSEKEKKYIENFIRKINIEKISLEKVSGIFTFLTSVIDPFILAVRKKCAGNNGKVDDTITFNECDKKTSDSIEKLYKEIETSEDFNKGFMARPQNSMKFPVIKNNYNQDLKNKMVSGALDVIENLKLADEQKKPKPDDEIDAFLLENEPTKAYDRSDSVDVRNMNALSVGDPNFENQVGKDATYFSSNYKTHTKKTQVVLLDVFPGTDAVYPYAITNFKVQLSENLIVSREADVQLEFINLHGIQGKSTVSGRRSLEHYHGLTLKITEMSKYFNSLSNLGDLNGKFYMPNDTFGYQDNDNENLVDSGVVKLYNNNNNNNTGPFIVTIPDNSLHSTTVNFYANMFFKVTTNNGREGEIRKITASTVAVENTSPTLTLDSDITGLDNTDTFEIYSEYAENPRTLNSVTLKLKNNFMCTMNPEKINTFTISLDGIERGSSTVEPLYLSTSAARLQIGLHIKER